MNRDTFWDALYRCDDKAVAACLAEGKADGTDMTELAQATLRWLHEAEYWWHVGRALQVLTDAGATLNAQARAVGLWALEQTVACAEKEDAESWWNSTPDLYNNLPLEGITAPEREILHQALARAVKMSEWEHVARLLPIAHRAGVDVMGLGRHAFTLAQDPENQFLSAWGWDHLPQLVVSLMETGAIAPADPTAFQLVGPLLSAAGRYTVPYIYPEIQEVSLTWAQQPASASDEPWSWEYLSTLLVALDAEDPDGFFFPKTASKEFEALVGTVPHLSQAASSVIRKQLERNAVKS